MLISHRLTEEEKKIICDWKYEGDYEIYNMPSYEEMLKKQWGFCNPRNEGKFKAYYDENKLVGFTNADEEEKEVFIGIGVNPNCCSNGYGQQMLQMLCKECGEKYPGKSLYLEVRTWNERAIACYKKAGFAISGEAYELETGLGKGMFYRMVRE